MRGTALYRCFLLLSVHQCVKMRDSEESFDREGTKTGPELRPLGIIEITENALWKIIIFYFLLE